MARKKQAAKPKASKRESQEAARLAAVGRLEDAKTKGLAPEIARARIGARRFCRKPERRKAVAALQQTVAQELGGGGNDALLVLQALERRLQTPKEKAAAALAAATSGTDLAQIASKRVGALRYDSLVKRSDGLGALLGVVVCDDGAKVVRALQQKNVTRLEKSRATSRATSRAGRSKDDLAAAATALAAAKSSTDPAQIASARLRVLRHKTPAKRRNDLDDLLGVVVCDAGAKVVRALRHKDGARLEEQRAKFQRRSGRSKEDAAAAATALAAAKSSTDPAQIASARLHVLRHNTPAKRRYGLGDLLGAGVVSGDALLVLQALERRLQTPKEKAVAALVAAKSSTDPALIASARLRVLRHNTPVKRSDDLGALLGVVVCDDGAKVVRALQQKNVTRLEKSRATSRATSRASYRKYSGRSKEGAAAAATALAAAKSSTDPAQIASARLRVLRHNSRGKQRDGLGELLRAGVSRDGALVLQALERRLQTPKEKAVAALAAAKSSTDPTCIASARLRALRHNSRGKQRDGLGELLRAGVSCDGALVLQALERRLQTPKEKAVAALVAAKSSTDPALIASARLRVLRHNTPVKRSDDLDDLLGVVVCDDGAEVVRALRQKNETRLEALRAHYQRYSGRSKEGAAAAATALAAATSSTDLAQIASKRVGALRYESPAKRRDGLAELLRAGVSGDGAKVVRALRCKAVASLEADREWHRRLRHEKYQRRLLAAAAYVAEKVEDVPAHLDEKRGEDAAMIADELQLARDAMPRGKVLRGYIGITQRTLEAEAYDVQHRDYIVAQLGEGAHCLEPIELFIEPVRYFARAREWAAQVSMASTARKECLFEKFAVGGCFEEGLLVRGYLLLWYVPGRSPPPTRGPAPPDDVEAEWRARTFFAGAVQAVPEPSEDDLQPLTLHRDEATATWCLYSVMTRGPFLKRAWSTNLEDLRNRRVRSTVELCDDADAAKAEARRVVAMKERKYEENPWKLWDTEEHLWNWASVDHTRSGDDDDVDGVSPAPLDGDADGAAPAPAPASEPPTPLRRLEPPAAYRAAKRYRHIRKDGVPIQYVGSPVPVALPVVALPPPLSPPTPLRAAQRPGRAALPPPSPPPASEPPTPLRRLEPTAAYRAAKRYRHIREDGVPIQYNGRLPSRPA